MKPEWVHFLQKMAEGQKKQVPDSIWSEVSKHLPQKPLRRRFMIWFWLMGGMLLSSGVTYSLLSGKDSETGKFGTIVNKASIKSMPFAKREDTNPSINQEFENLKISAPKENVFDQSSKAAVNREKLSKKDKLNSLKGADLLLLKKPAKENFTSLENSITILASSEQIEVSSERNSNEDISYLPVYPAMLLSERITLELPEIPLRALGKTDCYQFGKKKAELGLEVYVGPSYSPFQLKDKQDGFGNYIQKRKSTESIRPGIMAGVRLVYQKPSWAVKLGLEYQMFYEKLHYRNPNETRIISVYRNGIFLYSDTLNGDRVVKHHNYHHLLNVPLMIHFSKRWKSIDIGIQPGVGLNVWSQHQGKILDLQNEPRSFESFNGRRVFDKKIIPYLSFHIPISLPLSKHLTSFIEPGLQYYLKPFSAGAYPLEQTYLSYQLRIGVRMKI